MHNLISISKAIYSPRILHPIRKTREADFRCSCLWNKWLAFYHRLMTSSPTKNMEYCYHSTWSKTRAYFDFSMAGLSKVFLQPFVSLGSGSLIKITVFPKLGRIFTFMRGTPKILVPSWENTARSSEFCLVWEDGGPFTFQVYHSFYPCPQTMSQHLLIIWRVNEKLINLKRQLDAWSSQALDYLSKLKTEAYKLTPAVLPLMTPSWAL